MEVFFFYLSDLDTKQQSLLFQIDYPEISDNIVPKHRFMSGFEQHVEAPDRRWQYLLFAAEPYETISFKVTRSLPQLDCIFSLFQIPSREVDKSEGKFWTYYNSETKQVRFSLISLILIVSISFSSSCNSPSNWNRIVIRRTIIRHRMRARMVPAMPMLLHHRHQHLVPCVARGQLLFLAENHLNVLFPPLE